MSHSVFINYRRVDTAGHAGRISDDLQRRFGRGRVFRDIGSIGAGSNYVDALNNALTAARVVLVLIDDTWLTESDADGRRRLDDPQDFVRREVAAAPLRDDVLELPVLVEGARMPQPEDLPEALRSLTRLQAIELSEQRWQFDLDRLAGVLGGAGVQVEQPSYRYTWRRCAALIVLLLVAVAGVWFAAFRPSTTENYTGRWQLPDGSYWIVRAQRDLLLVEETHYESKQVSRRGEGNISDGAFAVALDFIFDQNPLRNRYHLILSRDGTQLQGTVTGVTSGTAKSVVLIRD